MSNQAFKPQLLPNNKSGEAPNWEKIFEKPENYMFSNKYDGARVEIFADGTIKGRSLKLLPSRHINQMAREIASIINIPENAVIEAEFYAPDMTFSEIMHFFKTEDVTSNKTVTKYQKLWDKTQGVPERGWKYPGRDVEWLTTWHDSLKFYAFDICMVEAPSTRKCMRDMYLNRLCDLYKVTMGEGVSLDLVYIPQWDNVKHVDAVYQMYDQAIMDGYEGVVAIHRDSQYKFGRHTLNSKKAYKIKNDNQEFDGIILSVEEGTVAREGAEKTVNELGRSKTSQLKEDRIPSGLAKGFRVRMDDGRELTVSLNGFNHDDRRALLKDPSEWIGQTIVFTGMSPVKKGGMPRHSMFTRVRDAKI